MFGLFKKKVTQPTVTREDKDWIEKNIIWFIEVFGLDKLRKRPFISPTADIFPYNDLKDTDQFQKLFEQLCQYWDINPNEIVVKFFDDIKSMQWTTWVPQGKFSEPGGLFTQLYTTEERRFNIQLAKSNLDNPQLLVSVIAHELAHVKLLGENYINRNDADLEPFTDLASIYFGFGIFVANSVQTRDVNWISGFGYLPNQLISYSNALICYITDNNADNYLALLNSNTKDLFKKDFDFLSTTGDTKLTKRKVIELETMFSLGQQIAGHFEKRNFEEAIEINKRLLALNPRNTAAFNNIGYALLQQKMYEQAIEEFTKAISINPYWDDPYCNRGYCKLQLGDIENAFADLNSAFEMNPDNSLVWRNLGAYYLKESELEKALQYFQEAEKIQPKTEMINFYLGQTHLRLNNTDLANMYLGKYEDLNEHNDSMIE